MPKGDGLLFLMASQVVASFAAALLEIGDELEKDLPNPRKVIQLCQLALEKHELMTEAANGIVYEITLIVTVSSPPANDN